jgi:hypothetical protein
MGGESAQIWGRPMSDMAASIEATATLFLEAAREAGMAVSGDLRVNEKNAAALLSISPAYLKELRLAGEGPAWNATPIDGCRYGYRIPALAAWVVMGDQ